MRMHADTVAEMLPPGAADGQTPDADGYLAFEKTVYGNADVCTAWGAWTCGQVSRVGDLGLWVSGSTQ